MHTQTTSLVSHTKILSQDQSSLGDNYLVSAAIHIQQLFLLLTVCPYSRIHNTAPSQPESGCLLSVPSIMTDPAIHCSLLTD